MHRPSRTVVLVVLLMALSLPLAVAAVGGEKVPDFSVTTLDGRTLRKSDLRGKVVVLDFWATWCGPCIRALPELKQLQAKMKGEPFALISVSVDDDKQQLATFVKKNDMTWTQGWDSSGQLAQGLFGVDSFPTYIVLDHEGGVVFRQRGWSPGRTARTLDVEIGKAIEAARRGAAAKRDVAR